MKRPPILTGLGVLAAMQVLGQTVVWDLIWESGMRDARLMSALWWTWTGVQIALAIPVGFHLVRWGLGRFAPPRIAERLPRAWVDSALASESNRCGPTKPRSAMIPA